MRLLKTKIDASETNTLEIQEFDDDNIPKYAILSHRWGNDELTLQDVERGVTKKGRKKDGFKKVQQCCSIAKSDGFDYIWIDTCCIDKTSSAELSEAINSMYLWYFKADRCYAYLADVSSKATIQESNWFTRGWTLQELLAPSDVYFLNKHWELLGTKEDLQQVISNCTGIPVNILSGDDLETCSIAQRMSWAANRSTKRLEDRAYCLLGIFGINIPLLYGEGERAFIRLQEEIMRTSDDHSLFAWEAPDDRVGLLATSPAAFKDSGNIIQSNDFDDSSHSTLTISSRGVHLNVQLIGLGPQKLGLAILYCKEQDEPNSRIAIYVQDLTGTMERFKRVGSKELMRLDLTNFRPSQCPIRRVCIQTGRIIPTQTSKHLMESNNVQLHEAYDESVLKKIKIIGQPEALLHAAQQGYQDDVWLMLTRKDIDINSKGPDEWSALFHAVNNGHKAVIKILLAQGADINMNNEDGCTPLVLAVKKGHEDIVKLLLDKGARMDIKVGQKKIEKIRRQLDATITFEQRIIHEWLQAIIQQAAGKNDRYIEMPVLIWATKNQHEGIIKLLLDKSTDADLKEKYNPVLHWAAISGYKDIVKWLLNRGVAVDLKYSDYWDTRTSLSLAWAGRTPLSLAAISGNEAIIELLVERGADIEVKDHYGQTPLFQAAGNENEAIIKLLVERGADIEAKDNLGRTPLSWAAENGNEAIIKLLVERGADIEAKDNRDQTLLSWAAENGNEAIAKLLVARGADIEAKDDLGQTPLSWAAENGNKAIIKLLVKSRADIKAKDYYS